MRIRAVCVITVFVLCVPAFAVGPKENAVKAALLAIYADSRKLMKVGKYKEALVYVAKDATLIDKKGKSHLYHALYRKPDPELARFTVENADVDISDVTLKGDTATVQTSETVTMKQTLDNGTQATITTNIVARDFWVKTGNAWQLKRSRLLSQTAEVNGKAIAIE